MASAEGVEREGAESEGLDPVGPVASDRAAQLRALERRRRGWRVIAGGEAGGDAEDREVSASVWLAGAEAALATLTSGSDTTAPAVVAERLRRLGAVAERVQATMAALAGSMDRSSQWAVEGATSPAAWLVGETPMGSSAAKRMVGAGRLLTRFEATGEAVADGSVSSGHAEVLAAAVLAKRRERLFGRDEAVLLAAARQLPIELFTRVVRRWAHLADDELDNGEPARAFERRGVSFAPLPSGNLRIGGELDASAGALVQAAFAAHDRPDPADGDCPPRTIAQRRADFLGDLAQFRLRHRNAEGHAPVATVDVIVDVDRLERLCGCPAHRRAGEPDHRGACADAVEDVDAAGTSDTAEAAGSADTGDIVDTPVATDTAGILGTGGVSGTVDVAGGPETGAGRRAGAGGPGSIQDDREGGTGGAGRAVGDPARWADARASGPLPVHVLEQLLCDCWVGRVVLRGGREVLDVGRRTRTWSSAQRRAIIARDRHCTHPGCTRGPEWCDVHHIADWDDGGLTAVDNGTLRCRWHHTWHHLHRPDHRRRARAAA
jgi:hypothetical protein